MLPHPAGLNLGAINVETDRRGFVQVTEKMEVLGKDGKVVPNVYCIGDANGKYMLAHAASAQVSLSQQQASVAVVTGPWTLQRLGTGPADLCQALYAYACVSVFLQVIGSSWQRTLHPSHHRHSGAFRHTDTLRPASSKRPMMHGLFGSRLLLSPLRSVKLQSQLL